jgi:hypothetical protein
VAEDVRAVDEGFGGIGAGVGAIAFGANSREAHYNSYLIILIANPMSNLYAYQVFEEMGIIEYY